MHEQDPAHRRNAGQGHKEHHEHDVQPHVAARLAAGRQAYIKYLNRVTGVRSEIAPGLGSIVRVVRRNAKILCAISTPEQAKAAGVLADGAIAGTAIVRLMEQYVQAELPPVSDYVRRVKQALQKLQTGPQ